MLGDFGSRQFTLQIVDREPNAVWNGHLPWNNPGFEWKMGSQESETNLLYVSVTRAKRQLFIFIPTKSNLQGLHIGALVRTMAAISEVGKLQQQFGDDLPEKNPPLAFISDGKVYRKDDDATHLPMFHQVEGIYVDKNVSFAQLKDLIYKIIYSLFGQDVKLRFRPSYFPFTEPSAEVDILSKEGKWLEVLGCGIVNPIVLDNCNIDANKYSGLAFGLGIERIAMLKHGVTDIRDFYKSNLDFLSQFK